MKMQYNIEANNSNLLPQESKCRSIKVFKRRYPIFPKSNQHLPTNEVKPNIENIPEQDLVIKFQIKEELLKESKQKYEPQKQFYKDKPSAEEQQSEHADEQLDQVYLPLHSNGQFYKNHKSEQQIQFYESFQSNFNSTGSSFLKIKSNSFVINEESQLYRELSLLKQTSQQEANFHQNIEHEVSLIESQIYMMNNERNQLEMKIYQINNFIEEFEKEKKNNLETIKRVESQISSIECRNSISSKLSSSQDQKSNENKEIQEQNEQIDQIQQAREFIIPNMKYHMEQDEDQFTISHIVPSHILTQFITQKQQQKQIQKIQRQEQRQKQRQIQQKQQLQFQKAKQKELNSKISCFHSQFKLSLNQEKMLKEFILEEHINNKLNIKFNLILRFSSKNSQKIGIRQDLEYKENLLIICYNQFNKTFGGYVSNHYIENQVIEDKHAFIFTKNNELNSLQKFKVKNQSITQAYSISKHYLICFGNDLMISSSCLEESFCEWPSSYESKLDKQANNQWFAGDFQFIIKTIQIYEVQFQQNYV